MLCYKHLIFLNLIKFTYYRFKGKFIFQLVLPLLCFLICRVFGSFKNGNDRETVYAWFTFSHWLIYANSAANPIIYNFLSGEFVVCCDLAVSPFQVKACKFKIWVRVIAPRCTEQLKVVNKGSLIYYERELFNQPNCRSDSIMTEKISLFLCSSREIPWGVQGSLLLLLLLSSRWRSESDGEDEDEHRQSKIPVHPSHQHGQCVTHLGSLDVA